VTVSEGRRARLVINADDFGLSPGVTRGILVAHRAGTVTSTSMLANLPAFDDAVQGARSAPDLGIGLHFNLTVGRPLTPPERIPSLADPATGHFHSLPRLVARAFSGQILPADVATECRAQMARLREHGLTIAHLDSHRHVHVLPGIWKAVSQAAEEAGIANVRLPFDAAAWSLAHPRALAEQIALRTAYRWAGGNGYQPEADHFRGGMLYPQRRFKERLLRVLDGLGAGLTELMVHPGYADPDLSQWDGYTWEREEELSALVDPVVRARLGAGDIALTTFDRRVCRRPPVRPATPRVSVIVPAYNESRYLPRLLASIDVARQRFSPDPRAVEVIVSDNQSTDGTGDVACERGARVVTEPRRVIGAVRNAGARIATGDVFLFVDADSVIHPETFTRVAAALETGSVIGGATGVTMDRWSAGIALTYAVLEACCWVSGWDTGVLFCGREAFLAVGGFPEDLLFAEDLAFYSALRRLGRARRKRFVRLPGVRTVTSTRKFDQFGDWGWPVANAKVLWFSLIHSPRARALVERHWYRVRP
jgi:predicted glycoside hydrolase/deacetylase ChbG (UPF0249 family)